MLIVKRLDIQIFLKVFKSKETIGSKQDSQNRLLLSMTDGDLP